MPQFIPNVPLQAKGTTSLPLVRLSVRGLDYVEARHEYRQDAFVIGSVPGCDLQLPAGTGTGLLALATISAGGLRIRRLDQPSTPITHLKPRQECQVGSVQLRLEFLAETTLSSVKQNVAPVPQEVADLKAQFEKDRQEWEAEAERQAESLAVKTRAVQEQEKQLQVERAELEQLRAGLNRSIAQPELPADLESVRSELLRLRDALYQQYRQRRDAVVAMRESVRLAATKVQEEKQQHRHEAMKLHQQGTQFQVDQHRLTEQQNDLAKQAKLLEEWQQQLFADQKSLAAEREALAQLQMELNVKTKELHDDLVRMQRQRDSLEQRQAQLEQHESDLKNRENYWSTELPKLSAMRAEVEQSEAQLEAVSQSHAQQARHQADYARQLDQQMHQLQKERQALQDRLAGCTAWEHTLGQDRLRLDRLEAEMANRREQLERDERRRQEEESAWLERQQLIETEHAKLHAEVDEARQVLAQRTEMEEEFAQRQAVLDEAMVENHQRSALLQHRLARLNQLRQRLRKQRKVLGDQLLNVDHSESAHESLQEQLRRRMATLTQREAQHHELEATYQARLQQVQADADRLAEQKRTWDATMQADRDALEVRRLALDGQAITIQKDRDTLAEHQNILLAQRQQLDEERRAALEQRDEVTGHLAELDQARAQFAETLPTLLRNAESALERVVAARSQLRTQLHEIHAYRQRCVEEIAARRQETAVGMQQLEERHQVLSRLQDEQRLEAAALRQDCLHWQSQIQLLESQWQASQEDIHEKSQRLASQARELEQNHSRLQVRSEELHDRERDVDHRRSEVNKHLADMQGWYRVKLKDMAEKKLPGQPAEADVELYDPPHILKLQSARADNDQHLADLLSGMGLIDAMTLNTLIEEARKQRLSLRNCLLQNEFLTPFQMELIEAGRLEALVLGPLRVIDRLRIGTMETIYRVFDPRIGDEALLRQLSASVDANWQEEYKTLFALAAQVQHSNVAGTLDVLQMAGSPAVLQEWVVGLPGSEWTQLVTDPSVALKLIVQLASGLSALHDAGLVHGQLHLGRLLLTPGGDLKLCGAGEPRWLSGLASTTEPTMADDLAAVVEFITPWCRGKARQPVSSAMTDMLKKLETKQITTAQQLHTAAYAVLRSLPQQEAAWNELLHFVQDRLGAAETPALKKSA